MYRDRFTAVASIRCSMALAPVRLRDEIFPLPLIIFFSDSVSAGGTHLTVTTDQDSDGGPVDGLVCAVETYAAALEEWRQRRQECGCGRPAVRS